MAHSSLVSTLPAGIKREWSRMKRKERGWVGCKTRECTRERLSERQRGGKLTLWINCPSCWKYTSPGAWCWIINSNLSEKEWEKSIDGDTGPLMVSLKGRHPTPCTFCTAAGVFGAAEGWRGGGDTWPPNDFLSLYHKQERLTCPSTLYALPSANKQTLGVISRRVQKCTESKRGSHACIDTQRDRQTDRHRNSTHGACSHCCWQVQMKYKVKSQGGWRATSQVQQYWFLIH